MERKRSDDSSENKVRRKVAGAAVLQSSVTEALHRALFEEWAETGYGALRMERIAARAGVGKAALYRRWKSKYALAVDAIGKTATTITPIPDTGTFAGDVRAMIQRLAVVLRHPLVRRILPDLHAERARSDEFSELLERVTRDRRDQAVAMIERSVARGELSEDVDRALVLDLLIAPLYWKIVVQKRVVTTRDVDRIANVVIMSVMQNH